MVNKLKKHKVIDRMRPITVKDRMRSISLLGLKKNMHYKWTKLQIIGFTAIILFVIFLFSIIVYQGLNQAEGTGTEVTGVVIEALIGSNKYTSNISMGIRAKLKSGKIVHVTIPVHPKITKGTKVIFKRYERALSGFNYRLYKYHTKHGLEVVKNSINEAY